MWIKSSNKENETRVNMVNKSYGPVDMYLQKGDTIAYTYAIQFRSRDERSEWIYKTKKDRDTEMEKIDVLLNIFDLGNQEGIV